MKTVFYLMFGVLLLLPAGAAAQQSNSMRCRNGIVSIDDTMPVVLNKCGPPSFQDRREQSHSYDKRRGRSSYDLVTVDDWVYNFGPQEFMYQVTFQNGRVARIESLEHGY